MSLKIIFSLLIITSVKAQLNGEFWWLNAKLNNLKKVNPTPPKIDNSDFEQKYEESSKIVFRDDDLFTNKLKPIKDRTSKLIPNNKVDENKVVWPTEEHMKNHNVNVEMFTTTEKDQEMKENITPIKLQNKYEDVLVFSYPRNDKVLSIDTNKISTESQPITPQSEATPESSTPNINAYTSKLSLPSTIQEGESQNICTYTTKKKCYQFNGFVYEYARRIPISSGDEALVCCILPIQPILNKNNLSQTIHFPQTSSLRRNKRSDHETNIALKQRDFLLKQKFKTQQPNARPASTPVTKMTASEDDYTDPYWNIKNGKPQIPTKSEITKYNEYFQESQEYTDELPRPGLIGLYSDHAQSPPNWPFSNENKGFGYGVPDDDYIDDEEDEEETFGYSTIDPRMEANKHRQKMKPRKVTTTDDELYYDAERQTVNFQSNPDFQVFQGFKLLNRFRNTSRTHTKKTSNQNSDVLVSEPNDTEETEEVIDENQFYDNCGRSAIRKNIENGNHIGDAASGSHPFLALVVLTKSRHNVLCYATLVHPRAAITIADCIEGTAPGDVSVIFGLWDLDNRARAKNRVATVHLHPRYNPGEAQHNLAILSWMQPLKLNGNIQPACLGRPEIGEECKLFGWGRLDQGIEQPRSRWQRATVRPCASRSGTNIRTRLQGDAFCVSTSRGVVTSIGGPLICEVTGQSFVVGVVVSRDNGYVLSPVRDWVMQMDALVNGD